MKKWVLKAIVQKTISYFPFKHRINFLFQKYITKGVQLSDEYFLDKLIHHQNHERFLEEVKQQSLNGISVLELGTGWYPVVPIAQYLSGASQLYSVDISPLMNKERLLTTIAKFIEYADKGLLDEYLPNLQRERFEVIKSIHQKTPASFLECQKILQFQYLVMDARQLSTLSDHSIQFITSNNVFEHIYPSILKGILQEFKRVLSKDGLMSHFIDMSDHFAHLDHTIDIYHFLRFSEQQWLRIDNSIQPQNRLRIPQYRTIYQELNIPIIKEENRPGDIEKVKATSLSEPFASMPIEEVAISHSYVVS